jgi:DNA-3-methyladenine glycosylase II
VSRRVHREPLPAGAADYLRGVDPVLARVIDRVGDFEPSHQPDLWRSLVDALAGQQLSVKAADAIVARIAALAGDEDGFPGPERILATPDEVLRACGLSGPKTRYLRDLAGKWIDGTLRPERYAEASDAEIVAELTQVRGIGRWTAEMVLIFTLSRPDVLPVGDLGLRAAVQRAWELPERPKEAEVERLGEAWRPYRSVATHYLWRSLNT